MKKFLTALAAAMLTTGASFAVTHNDFTIPANSGADSLYGKHGRDGRHEEADGPYRLRGFAEVGMLANGSTDIYGYVDAMIILGAMGVGPSGSLGSFGSGLPFALMLGVEGFVFSDGTEVRFNPALGFRVGGGKLQVGMPKPALDRHVYTPRFANNALLGLEFGWFGRSEVSWIMFYESVFGVRYDHRLANTKFGVSAHFVPGWDGAAITGGLTSKIGDNIKAFAGFEHYTGEGSLFHAGGKYYNDKVKALLGVISDGDDFAVQGHANYMVTEKIDVGVDVLTFPGGDAFYGINGSYWLTDKVELGIGYTTANFGGDVMSAQIRYKF